MRKTLAIFSSTLLLACDAPTTNCASDYRHLQIVPQLELVTQFSSDPTLPPENPESVTVMQDGRLAISMALTGEIRIINQNGSQETLTYIPLGQCAPNPFPAIMGALAVDDFNNIYVGAATCDPSSRGVYRVSSEGESTLIASLPTNALPNGIAIRGGQVYVADSASTKIWRAPIFGDGSPAEVWTEEPLLADPTPTDLAPGANGLQFYKGSLWVANASAQTIVEIPFYPGGSFGSNLEAGMGRVAYGPASTAPEHETPDDFPGCDDFAFDVVGNIYCTTDPFQTVVQIGKDGSVKTLWTAEDGLDGPTAAAFGRFEDSKTIYITNAAFPFFPSTGNGPSLMKAQLHFPGWPFR